MGERKDNNIYKYWVEGEGLEQICEWVKHGLKDQQVAQNIGVSRTTLYNWQQEFSEFDAVYKKAKLEPNIEIENAMFNLACGKTFVEEIKSVLDPKTGTIIKIEKIRKQIPPSAVLLIFLAKNRMRDKYKDYAPIQSEPENTNEQTDVQIYLPDNGREMNDSKTAERTSREIFID